MLKEKAINYYLNNYSQMIKAININCKKEPVYC